MQTVSDSRPCGRDLAQNPNHGYVPVKKRDLNQMDLFAMTNPEPSAASPLPPPPAPQPQPAPAPVSETTESTIDSSAAPLSAPESDTSFDPTDWETPEPDASTSPDVTPATSLQDSTPATETDDDFALFESDPFFNPSIPASQSLPPRATPHPRPLAEEQLLEHIVQHVESDTGTQIESGLDHIQQELQTLRNRCSTLEAERDSARREADKERQLRTEAVRNKPVPTFKPIPQEIHARRHDSQEGLLSRRTLYLALPGVLVLCLLAYSLGRRHAPGTITVMAPDLTPPPLETPASPNVTPVAPLHESPAPVAWPSFNAPGYRVTGDTAARRIVFNYGTFTRGSQLSEAAQRDLARIAAAFKADIAAFRIEVEGYTDATPVRSTHAFADNHELALARATAAMEFMTGKCGLPEDTVTAVAGRDTNPPHPGTTPDIQKKNRTVVLNITRR